MPPKKSAKAKVKLPTKKSLDATLERLETDRKVRAEVSGEWWGGGRGGTGLSSISRRTLEKKGGLPRTRAPACTRRPSLFPPDMLVADDLSNVCVGCGALVDAHRA